MTNLIIGLGVQGKKRIKNLTGKKYFTVDPFNEDADYKSLNLVNLKKIKHAYICTPEEQKFRIITYLLNNNINVLVEKPLILNSAQELKIKKLINKNKCILYTAYNHRFEPHFVTVKKILNQKKIGKIYSVNLFYGNGTSKLWKNSWRERKKFSILQDLGVHLIDTFDFWFGYYPLTLKKTLMIKNELKCYDYFSFNHLGKINCNFTTSIINWRNTFRADIIGSKGSLHIDCLCKWGPSTLTIRQRKLPSGKPKEKIITLKKSDPTWKTEEKYFKRISKQKKNNFVNDINIRKSLESITL
jgi:predicted dehydrogenase